MLELEEFEKSTCATVVKGLELKLLTDRTTLSANILTSLIICCYMKTFDNQDTNDFLKSIKKFCGYWPYKNSQHAVQFSSLTHSRINPIMSEEMLTDRNKPLIELLYGETITKENEV